VSGLNRLLTGCRLNISISESTDSTDRGHSTSQVNRVTLQAAAALVGQGAGVVFGHDWRDDGVMEAVHGFAQHMQPPSTEGGEAEPLLWNLLPWPKTPGLELHERQRMQSTLRVDLVGLPEQLARYTDYPSTGPYFPYLQAGALTFLRQRLTDESQARLCLGGKLSGYSGRYPGIVEEAILAIRAHMPLYISGYLGGASRAVADALQGSPMPEAFRFSKPRYPRIPDDAQDTDHDFSPEESWDELRTFGVEGISRVNGLEPKQNVALFQSAGLDDLLGLVLGGLGRLRAEKRI